MAAASQRGPIVCCPLEDMGTLTTHYLLHGGPVEAVPARKAHICQGSEEHTSFAAQLCGSTWSFVFILWY